MSGYALHAAGLLRLGAALALLGAWGWTLGRRLLGADARGGDGLAYAAGLSVGTVGALGYLAWSLGLGLDAVVWATVVLGVAGLAAARLRAGGRGGDPAAPARPLRAIGEWFREDIHAVRWGAFAVIVAALEGIWLSDSVDMFYHLAAVRALLAGGGSLVTDLIVTRAPVAGLDPTAGMWPTFLAVLSRLSGLDPVSLVRWLSPVLGAITAWSFLALVRRTVGPRGRTAAMVLMLVVAYWMDFRLIAYPNRISLAFVATALAAMVAYAQDRRPGALICAVVLAATVAAMHLVSFLLAAAALGLFAILVLVRGGRGRVAVAAACALALAVGGAVAWSKVGSTIAATGTFALGSLDKMVDARARIPMLRLGPLAAMAPGAWLQGSPLTLPGALMVAIGLMRRERAAVGARGEEDLERGLGGPQYPGAARWPVPPGDLMAASLALIMPLVAWNLVATDYIVDRLWYHVARLGAIWPIFLGVPVGALYQRLADAGRRSWGRQLAIAILAAGVLVTGARLGAMLGGPRNLASLWHSRAYDLGRGWGGHAAEVASAMRADGATVVAAPLGLSYHAAGLMPVRVVAVASAHMPYAVEQLEGAERRRDISTLLSSGVTKAQTRRILDGYDVGWIMTWTDEKGRLLPATARHLERWPDVAVPVLRRYGVAVFRVER